VGAAAAAAAGSDKLVPYGTERNGTERNRTTVRSIFGKLHKMNMLVNVYVDSSSDETKEWLCG
jgi:hypothetical protein